MPLFALVSGYLFFWSAESRTPRELIMRQTNSLILPAFSWTLLMKSLRATFHALIGDLAGAVSVVQSMPSSFLYGFWFLWAMFLASLAVILAREKFRDNLKFYIFSLVICLFVPGNIIPSKHIFVYPYFIAGYLWHRENVQPVNSKLIRAGIVLLWCSMLIFYDRSSYVYTTGTQIANWSGFRKGQLWIDLFRWMIGFAGCGAVLILLNLIKPVTIFSKLGVRSIGIYIMSGYVMKYLPEQGGYIINFLEAVVISGVCYVLSEGISRVKVLNMLLFGSR